MNVQQWIPQFDCFKEKIKKITAWIRLPGMPLHYYHKKIIRLLGNVVGTVLKIDYNTELVTRGKFARIAVEVNLDRPLVSQFLLDGKIQKVEYESLPTICFSFGRYGHMISSCPERSNIGNPEANVDPQNSNDLSSSKLPSAPTAEKATLIDPRYGPWMVVTRKRRNQYGKEKEKLQDYANNQKGNFNQGSRFGALLEDEDGKENQGVENESSVAMLRSHVPANTNLQDLIGTKHLKPRKNTRAFKQATKQTLQAQRRKTQDSMKAHNTANPTEKSLNNPMQNLHILRTQTKDHELQPSLTPYSPYIFRPTTLLSHLF